MFPPSHPAVAYLLYGEFRRVRDSDPPDGYPTLALVAGAVLPDLIDQPIHGLAAVPSTRTLAHSLLFGVVVCLAVATAVRRFSRPNTVAVGFAVGYLSHLAADALWPLLLGYDDELGFLLWPITQSPPYAGEKPLFAVGDVLVTTTWVELLLLAGGLGLWWADGRPGLRPIRRWLDGVLY